MLKRGVVVLPFLMMSGAKLALANEVRGNDVDIIVTAQHHKQSSLDVPIALSVLEGEDIARLGVGEFDSLSRFVPGFNVQNQSPNNPGFVLRGITSDSGAAYNEPRIAIFQDGVSISKSRGSYVSLFDVERVEVAKGPQTTLYGRGALIGAVNIVQNRANTDTIAWSGKVSRGNFNAWTLDGMVNAPLGESVAIRIAGYKQRREGYIRNLLGGDAFNSVDTNALRGAFHIDREGLKIDVIANYQKDHSTGTSFKSVAFRPTNPVTGDVLGDVGRNSAVALAAGANFPEGDMLGMHRTVWGVTAITNLAVADDFNMTSITAYRQFHALEVLDIDGISLPLLTGAEDALGKQISQEMRLTYERGLMTAFIGASYFHENGSQRTPAQFDERITLAQLGGMLNGGSALTLRPPTDPAPLALFSNTILASQLLQGVAMASGYTLDATRALAIADNLSATHLETSTNQARTDAVDLFGDINIKLSDRLELGAGLRYSLDDKTTRYSATVLNGRSILGSFMGALSQSGQLREALLAGLTIPGALAIPFSPQFPVPMFGLNVQPTAGNGRIDSATNKDGGFSWRVTARYQPGDNTSLYATYARGRRPKVLSATSPRAPFGFSRFALLPAETVDSFDLGVKMKLANRRLLVDGALYFYKYQNFQTFTQQGVQRIVTNAGRAESYGFEGQMRWVPNDFITFFANYAFNHGRFQTGLRDGNHFRLSPDHSASLGAYISQSLPSGRISLTPSLTWQSKTFFDDDNDRSALQQRPTALVSDNIVDEFQNSYALVNLRLGYEALDKRWCIEAFANNVFNKKYIKEAGNVGDGLGLPTFVAGEPRFYGLSAVFRWSDK